MQQSLKQLHNPYSHEPGMTEDFYVRTIPNINACNAELTLYNGLDMTLILGGFNFQEKGHV